MQLANLVATRRHIHTALPVASLYATQTAPLHAAVISRIEFLASKLRFYISATYNFSACVPEHRNQNIQLDCSYLILYLVMDGGGLIFCLLPVSNYKT